MSRDLEMEEDRRPEWITDEIAQKMRYLEEMWENLSIRKLGTKEYRRLEELEDDLVFKIVRLGEVHPSYDPLWMVKAKDEFLMNRKV
jgi:hypothetical protein